MHCFFIFFIFNMLLLLLLILLHITDTMIKINDLEEYKSFKEKAKKGFVILLKHSDTCPISAAAYKEFSEFLEENNVDAYYLVVQESRDVSKKVEEDFEVKHESPQILFLKDNKVMWTDSHYGVNKKSLENQLKQI